MKFKFNYNDSTLWVGTSRYLRSPKEVPTYAINDTIHSTCRQIQPRDWQKKKKKLTHQGEHRI